MSTKPAVSRRALLVSGTRLSLLGAFCATVGSTIIAACTGSGSSPNCPGAGYGYVEGCGYGYGYDDDDGNGYGGGYGGYGS
ncbi:MAG: hypothetical protein ABI867_13020 [Kofleriaceae bacterium]